MSLRDRWNRFRSPRRSITTEAGTAPARTHTVGRVRLVLAALLCLVNGALSGLLLLQHHGDERASAAVSQVCGEGDQSGCEVVARSRFSEVGGVPLAAVGVFFYIAVATLLLLALLAGPETRAAAASIALLALVAAVAVDLVLLGVQMVAIRAFCRLCLLTYAVNVLALLLVVNARRDGAVVGQAVRRTDGRVALAGWVLATLALGVAVLASEVGLSYREKERLATLLGPAPAASPSIPAVLSSPVPPGSDAQRFQEEARAATEQARRLQEILDNPQRLEQYFADKAAREFEQGPAHKLQLEGVPVKGPANAPIKVAEFSDFLCPFCRQIAGAFSQYMPASAGRVAIFYKNYPLETECNPHVERTLHPGACVLARGGICAAAQDKFWPYHDRVFATELKDPKAEDVSRLAAEAGLDAGVLQACLGSAATQAKLAGEIEEAWKAGVRGTPTLFINGKKLPRINDFVQTVDKEAARLGLPPLPKGAAGGR
jgi:serine/threonine-protein kinase